MQKTIPAVSSVTTTTNDTQQQNEKNQVLDNLIDELLQAPVPGDDKKIEKVSKEPVPIVPPKVKLLPVLKLVHSVAQINVVSHPLETYSKEIQTDENVRGQENTIQSTQVAVPSPAKQTKQEVEEDKNTEQEVIVDIAPEVDANERKCVEDSECKYSVKQRNGNLSRL